MARDIGDQERSKMKEASVKMDIKMPSQIYRLFMPGIPSIWGKTITELLLGCG